MTTTGGVTFTYTDTAPEITSSTNSAPDINWEDGSGTSKVITIGENGDKIAAGTYTITYTVVCNDPPLTLEQDSKVKNKIRASYKDESHEASTETKLKNDMISKSGKLNNKKSYIEWTVKINTPTSDGSLAYLEKGAAFTDTLPDDLVDGEIKVKMDGASQKVDLDTVYNAETKTITYPLEEGRHYYEITYKTKAPENNGLTDITVSNTGNVTNDGTTSSDTDEVTISSNILSKKLEDGTTADGTATMDWSTTISADDLNGYTYYDWSGVLTDSDGKWCKAQKIVEDSVKVITEDNKNVTDKVTIHYDYSKMDDSHSEVDVGLFSVDFSVSNITGPVTITYQTTTNAAALPSGNTTIYNYGKLNDGKTVSDKYSFKNDNAAVDVVRKQGTFDESTGTLTYNVMVNPTGRQLLNEENGQLLLHDSMKFSGALSGDKKTQYLWLEGISVYKGEFVNGEYVPTTFLRELIPVSVDYNDNEFDNVNTTAVSTTQYFAKYNKDFNQVKVWTKVPDSTPLVLVFHYTVDTSHVIGKKQLTFTNDVTLQNNDNWHTTNSDVSFTPTTSGGASIDYNNDRLTIFKYGDTVNHPLEGAEFLLEKWDADQKQWVTVNDSIKTNSKGNDVLSVDRDTLYRILETKAPAGYLMPRGNAYYYFRVTRNTDAYTPPDGSGVIAADVHTYQVTTGKDDTYQTFYYNVANEKDPDYVPTGSLKVTKLWQDSNGDAITDSAKLGALPTVTVTLTKYSDSGSTQIGDPVTLNNDNGWTSTWSDLETSDGIYYTIKESTMDGYTTHYRLAGSELYDACPQISLSGANGASVQIVNQSTQAGYELPSTGGAGTTLYTAVGGTMVLAALVCGFCQKRRRERRAD